MSLFVSDAHSAKVQARLRSFPEAILVSPFGVAEFAAAIGNRVRAGAMRQSADWQIAAAQYVATYEKALASARA